MIRLIRRDDPRLASRDWRRARFRELLEASGFSMQEMADIMGVSYNYVRQLKSNANIDISADLLRLTAYELAFERGMISEHE